MSASLVDAPKKAADVIVVGAESVGKSSLVAGLTGRFPHSANFRGTTIACERYRHPTRDFVDTPGLLFDDSSVASREALARLSEADTVLAVVSALDMADQFRLLLPHVAGKRGAVALTFWDRVQAQQGAKEVVQRLQEQLGVPVLTVNARRIDASATAELLAALDAGARFPTTHVELQIGFSAATDSMRDPLQWPLIGPILALALQFVPAWLAVTQANAFADAQFERVQAWIAPVLDIVNGWPAPLSHVLGGDYGFVAMFPFLLLYALPTVLIFSLLLAIYKTTGLIDRLTVALHPLLHPFGLTGRDLVRVIMGFGCNVPAVINSRACSASSRGACVSAISFGSACSYQLPATLAVLAAAGHPRLALPFLLWLAGTTLIYLRCTVPKELREANRRLTLQGRDILQWPSPRQLMHEAGGVLVQFVFMALPVFVLICGVAGLLAWSGALDFMARLLAPAMSAFNLPGEAALAVILGSIRKDGLAIGLLDAEWNALKVPLTTPVQVLTAVYLAGVLLPCVVTLLTMARELSWRYALRAAGRQALFAAFFSIALAWGGAAYLGIFYR